MDNLDESEMTDDCENRLIEVQYFMARYRNQIPHKMIIYELMIAWNCCNFLIFFLILRDWTLDPQLYEACHTEAVSRCSANKNWNENSPPIGASQAAATVNPGPQVLACLYRNAYDEQQPLSRECAHHVHRVLRERAIRVNLIPEVEWVNFYFTYDYHIPLSYYFYLTYLWSIFPFFQLPSQENLQYSKSVGDAGTHT